jgi:hypothetical protein
MPAAPNENTVRTPKTPMVQEGCAAVCSELLPKAGEPELTASKAGRRISSVAPISSNFNQPVSLEEASGQGPGAIPFQAPEE